MPIGPREGMSLSKGKEGFGSGGFNPSGKDRPMSNPEPAEISPPDAATIAAQNDAFRRLACLGIAPDQPIQGRMHVTRSLMEAGDGFMAEAVKATGAFETFEPENDPEGWHDFGAVTIRGETVFWKIDMFEADSDFRYGAETPDNPKTTMRVLTVMMARDW
tara:strand:+ start:3247 stop:3729 length:483 start_codon:yes stop_codon:yes gene_type:complete